MVNLNLKNINIKTIRNFLFILVNLKIIAKMFQIYIYYINHPFWFYKEVAHNYNLLFYRYFKKGIINNSPMRNHEYHNITELTDINDEIVSFINENYSDKVTNTIYKYTPEYLKHICHNKPTIYSIFDTDNNKLFEALGIGYPTKLNIDKKLYSSYYSDYFCVKESMRSKGLFKSILNCALDHHTHNKCKIFLFKRDFYPLPIKHLVKYTYHLIFDNATDINNENFYKQPIEHTKHIKTLNNDLHTNPELFNAIYDLYLNNIKRKSLHNVFQKKEFLRYLNNENITLYAYYVSNDTRISSGSSDSISSIGSISSKIYSVLCIYNTHIKGKSGKDTYEIAFTLYNDYNDNNALDTLDRLTKKIRGDFRDKYIIASSINGNEYLASVRDALRNDRKLSTCYYYLYNFNSDEYMNSDVFLLYL